MTLNQSKSNNQKKSAYATRVKDIGVFKKREPLNEKLQESIINNRQKMSEILKVLKDAFPECKEEYGIDINTLGKLACALARIEKNPAAAVSADMKIINDAFIVLYIVFQRLAGDEYIADNVKQEARHIINEYAGKKRLFENVIDAVFAEYKIGKLSDFVIFMPQPVVIADNIDSEFPSELNSFVT